MSHFKTFLILSMAIILGYSYSASVYAAMWATVSVDKAVVYSDVQMTSKIGYIKKGKRIRVGEKPRNHGRLLPIVVKDRVAYIQISDIQTSTRLAFLKSATQRLKEQGKKKDIEQRVSFTGSSILTTLVFDESPTAESQLGMVFLGFGVKGYRSDPEKRTGLRGGIEYLAGTHGDHNFNYWSASADYFYKFMKTEFADIYLFGGGSVIPFATYQLGSLFTLNGYGYGMQAGGEMIFKYHKYAIHLEGAYRYTQLLGFEINGSNPDYPSSISPTAHGFALMASISFGF